MAAIGAVGVGYPGGYGDNPNPYTVNYGYGGMSPNPQQQPLQPQLLQQQGPMGVQPVPANMGGGYNPMMQQQQPIQMQPKGGVITVQPSMMNRMEIDNTKWHIGLCDCFNSCGTCALVFFCEPIAECIAANKMNENCCYPFCCPNGIVPISVRFRSLHRIEMGMCEEAFCWSCCRMCMLCRLLNEMRVRGR